MHVDATTAGQHNRKQGIHGCLRESMRGRAPAVVGSPTRAEGRVALVRVPHGVPGPTHLRAPSAQDEKRPEPPLPARIPPADFIGQGEIPFMKTHLTDTPSATR